MGLKEVFTVKMEQMFFQYQLHKVPKGGCGDWWVRLILFVVVLANNFDLFFLWDVGLE